MKHSWFRIQIVFLLLLFCGCASMQMTYSEKKSGRIAQSFRIEEKNVDALFQQGFDDEEVVKILMMSTATHTERDRIIEMRQNGIQWAEMCEEREIDADVFTQEFERLFAELSLKKTDE